MDALLCVEATGFEPAASASRTQRSTKLSHASNLPKNAARNMIQHGKRFVKFFVFDAIPLNIAGKQYNNQRY